MLDVVSGPAAGLTRSALHEEVATRLGVLPNFFCTAASAPGLIDRLWDFARSAYFDSPLPALFKERLFVHLSRFCEVRYCIVRHVGFLVGKGYPAGDIACPPQSIPQVVAMLRRPVPTRAGFLEAASRLAAEPATETMPEPETDREAALFDALSLIFLEPRRSLPARQAVASALGEANLEMLTAFLAFVRTAHFWTETHGDLEFEPDMVALMQEHPDLAELLLVQSEAERTWSPMERAELLSALAEQREQLHANEQRLDALVVARTAELMQAEEALRQSQKLEAIGQLTGGVAHDFNNLLTVIKSSTDLLKRPNLAEDRRLRYVAAISDTVDRAAKLTGQLLAFARRQALKPEVFDAVESVRSIGDMIGTLTGSRIRIVMELPDAPCFLDADPSQFDTALVNMAVNARDAMDGQGQLTIRVAAVAQMPAVRAHTAISGAFAAISITDTGSGIPEGQLDQIFEPFFTTKGIGQGTGLGLSQVFGFAKQSGGEVMVASTVGKGATFTLYLPSVQTERQMVDVSEPEALMDGHGTCVLVVEDNIEVGTFAVQTLRDLGYETVWAANADEALTELRRDAERFDVVFTDVVMPGMNGIDLAHEIRRQYYDLPVLLASGYSHVLAQNGTYGFELLHKPYSIENLSRLLRKVATWQRRKRSIGA